MGLSKSEEKRHVHVSFSILTSGGRQVKKIPLLSNFFTLPRTYQNGKDLLRFRSFSYNEKAHDVIRGTNYALPIVYLVINLHGVTFVIILFLHPLVTGI